MSIEEAATVVGGALGLRANKQIGAPVSLSYANTNPIPKNLKGIYS
jgi:hypothetical protein